MDRLQFLRNIPKRGKESIHIYEVRDGKEDGVQDAPSQRG